MLSRRKRHSSGGYLLLVGYSSQPSWFNKTVIFRKAGEGGEVMEVLVPTGSTQTLFPHREGVPLCFLALKAGGGEGRGKA